MIIRNAQRSDTMKLVQCIGSRDKTDFLLFLAYTARELDKRVLIVDATKKENYRYGYTKLMPNEYIYDFHKIDILCGAEDWADVEETLQEANETASNYDLILVDIDSIDILENKWPSFEKTIYIGDYNRIHLHYDVPLLKFIADSLEEIKVKKVLYTAYYPIDEEYLDDLLEYKVTWDAVLSEISIEEIDLEEIRLKMQYDYLFPYKNLNSSYRHAISDVISLIFNISEKDVKHVLKSSFFHRDKREKSKQQPKIATNIS